MENADRGVEFRALGDWGWLIGAAAGTLAYMALARREAGAALQSGA